MLLIESVAYDFGPEPGLIQFNHPSIKLPSTTHDELAFGICTNIDDAVIVHLDSISYDDYIELKLVSH